MKIDHNFKVGDKVRYSREFLRSIQDYTAESANREGTVIKIDIKGFENFVKIKWEDEEGLHFALSRNLWPADKIHLEPV